MALLNVALASAGAPIVAALAVAPVFNPLRLLLQRRGRGGDVRHSSRSDQSLDREGEPAHLGLVLGQRSDEPVREARLDNFPGQHI
jgi:hypothetical protein